MTICGVKFRAYPTSWQSRKLAQWIGCSRVIYNCKVEEDQLNYQIFKEIGEKVKVNQAFSHFKTEERNWLNDCPSQILETVLLTGIPPNKDFLKN